MQAAALLAEIKNPADQQISDAMAGNISAAVATSGSSLRFAGRQGRSNSERSCTIKPRRET